MSNPVKKFEILLDHEGDDQYQYHPGETMRGRVLLSNDENIRVKAIVIEVKGEATVSWSSEEAKGEQFSTSEIYVNETLVVLDCSETDGEGDVVTRGEHSYPFEYHLSDDLPSSFIGKYGGVTYILKATLRDDRLGGFGTTITSEPFLVLRQVDLASNPSLQEKRSVVASKRSMALLFCLYGKTAGEFSVRRTGILPGEDLLIDADVQNEGTQPIKSIQAALVLISTFQAKKLTKKHTQVVQKKVDNSEVEYGDRRKWSSIKLAIPSYIPASRLDGCDMIDIEYELQFRLEMVDGSEVRAKIPITVGTPKTKNSSAALEASEMENNGYEKTTTVQDQKRLSGNWMTDRVEMETDLEKFRHPMVPGETRKNILYED